MANVQVNDGYIIGEFNEGVESKIYKYMYNGNPNNIVLYKEFKRILEPKKNKNKNRRILVSDGTIKNKRDKIEIIKSLKYLEDDIQILDSMYKEDNFTGYTMTQSHFKSADCFTSKKKKIILLKSLVKKIERLNSEGIFIGDISARNILVSDDYTKFQLCDLDNFRIGDLDFDLPNLLVRTFNQNCSSKDLVDCYVFNLFTVCFLKRISV